MLGKTIFILLEHLFCVIFGQLNAVRRKKVVYRKIQILPFWEQWSDASGKLNYVVNTCVTAPISIIDTFVSYVVIEKTILSNLFSQGIISNISWYGNVTRVTEMLIFLHTEINPWKLALKVVILLLRIVLDEIVTILHLIVLDKYTTYVFAIWRIIIMF